MKSSSLLIRILIYIYFPLLFISYEIGKSYRVFGVNIRFIFFLPFFLYSIFWLLKTIQKKNKLDPFIFKIGLYVLFTIIFFFSKDAVGLSKYEKAFILLVHVLFWYSIFSDLNNYKKAINHLKYFFRGILLTFIVIGFFPSILKGKLEIGGYYDLRDILFFSTNVDPSLLSLVSIIICYIGLIGYLKHKNIQIVISNKTFAGISYFLLLVIMVPFLFFISKRGPIFSLFIVLIIISVPKIFFKRIIIFILLIIVAIPFLAWDFLVPVFNLVDFDFLSSFFYKKDFASYINATGRIHIWKWAYDLINSFQFKNLFMGFDILDYQFSLTIEKSHFHNGFLQLFYDTGFINVLLLFFMILSAFKKSKYIMANKILKNQTIILVGILFAIIILSIFESLFRAMDFSHLLLLTIIIIVERIHCFTKKNTWPYKGITIE